MLGSALLLGSFGEIILFIFRRRACQIELIPAQMTLAAVLVLAVRSVVVSKETFFHVTQPRRSQKKRPAVACALAG